MAVRLFAKSCLQGLADGQGSSYASLHDDRAFANDVEDCMSWVVELRALEHTARLGTSLVTQGSPFCYSGCLMRLDSSVLILGSNPPVGLVLSHPGADRIHVARLLVGDARHASPTSAKPCSRQAHHPRSCVSSGCECDLVIAFPGTTCSSTTPSPAARFEGPTKLRRLT